MKTKVTENGIEYEVVEYSNGYKEWCFEGKRHRINGPAIEYSNGYKAWWFEDKSYTKNDYYKRLFKEGLISEEDCFLEMV